MIFITVLAIWIFSLCLHEFSHARVAYAGGDYTVKEKGYLSFNPFHYMSPMNSIVFPAIFLALGMIALPGGAVWIETWRLRSKGWQSLVSLAGPLANLFMCIVLGLPFLLGVEGTRTPPSAPANTMWAIVAVSCYWQAVAVVLNLIPIPGLDGYGVVEPWLPEGAKDWGRRFKQYGIWVIFILFMGVPQFGRAFQQVVFKILGALRLDREALITGIDGMNIFNR